MINIPIEKILFIDIETVGISKDFETLQKENKKFSYLGFVIHSNSFNQSVKRYKYLQQLSEIRKNQAELLKQTRLEINKTINVIHRQIGEKEKIRPENTVATGSNRT